MHILPVVVYYHELLQQRIQRHLMNNFLIISQRQCRPRPGCFPCVGRKSRDYSPLYKYPTRPNSIHILVLIFPHISIYFLITHNNITNLITILIRITQSQNALPLPLLHPPYRDRHRYSEAHTYSRTPGVCYNFMHLSSVDSRLCFPRNPPPISQGIDKRSRTIPHRNGNPRHRREQLRRKL